MSVEPTTDDLYCYHPSWSPTEAGQTCDDCGQHRGDPNSAPIPSDVCALCGQVQAVHGPAVHHFAGTGRPRGYTAPPFKDIVPKHTHEDLFPWSWEQPEVHRTYECDRCGAAVSNTDTHLAWHNGEDF